MTIEPRRRGRPPKPASERRRNNLTIRIRDALREKLEEQAVSNQRSLSEEAEMRLERSVAEDDLRNLASFLREFAVNRELTPAQEKARDHLIRSHPLAWAMATAGTAQDEADALVDRLEQTLFRAVKEAAATMEKAKAEIARQQRAAALTEGEDGEG